MLKKVTLDLFWFFKRGAVLDLKRPGTRHMYVQQVLSHGHEADIRELIKDIGLEDFKVSFEEIKSFLPPEVRLFWEDFFADHHPVSR